MLVPSPLCPRRTLLRTVSHVEGAVCLQMASRSLMALVFAGVSARDFLLLSPPFIFSSCVGTYGSKGSTSRVSFSGTWLFFFGVHSDSGTAQTEFITIPSS